MHPKKLNYLPWIQLIKLKKFFGDRTYDRQPEENKEIICTRNRVYYSLKYTNFYNTSNKLSRVNSKFEWYNEGIISANLISLNYVRIKILPSRTVIFEIAERAEVIYCKRINII